MWRSASSTSPRDSPSSRARLDTERGSRASTSISCFRSVTKEYAEKRVTLMRMKRLIPLMALLATAACGGDTPTGPTTTSAPYSQTDLVLGTGTIAATGNTVNVTYTGWLHDSTKPAAKGAQFDSGTISFMIGTTNIIQGWNQGVPGMRVGGQRRLVIPPELAYGSAGRPPTIGPNNTLVFDIALNAVQ